MELKWVWIKSNPNLNVLLIAPLMELKCYGSTVILVVLVIF